MVILMVKNDSLVIRILLLDGRYSQLSLPYRTWNKFSDYKCKDAGSCSCMKQNNRREKEEEKEKENKLKEMMLQQEMLNE